MWFDLKRTDVKHFFKTQTPTDSGSGSDSDLDRRWRRLKSAGASGAQSLRAPPLLCELLLLQLVLLQQKHWGHGEPAQCPSVCPPAAPCRTAETWQKINLMLSSVTRLGQRVSVPYSRDEGQRSSSAESQGGPALWWDLLGLLKDMWILCVVKHQQKHG